MSLREKSSAPPVVHLTALMVAFLSEGVPDPTEGARRELQNLGRTPWKHRISAATR